ncbi:unnamed protein product [Chironomus riparius]|uniref:F-box domain-containing protein n=1 Tax=Chironomus riparius TaxID=315576 RepID=A0A9N9WU36_9DIPT|nr:unnamed protein product [Chironomus riparius]
MDILPNEILLKIFEFADCQSLKVLLDVSYNFRELIITNSNSMRKLPLSLSKSWLSKVEFANDCGEFVKILNMDYTSFDSFDEFKTVMTLFPNIEKLKINYIYIKQPAIELTRTSESDKENVEEVTYENLKSVEISSKFWGYITQLDMKIMDLLNTSHLEELLIKLPMQKFSQNFIDFLCKQSKLKVLQIYDEFIDSFLFDDFTESLTYNQFVSSLFEIDLSTCATFQLKKLSINFRGDHRENFVKFLETQSDLEELVIKKYEDDFVRFKITFDLLRNFRVRKLTIPLELIQSNNLLDYEFFVNKNVTDLSLEGYNNDVALFNLMLKIFPNIKRLRLEYMLDFLCEDLATLAHLETLEVDHFKIDSLRNIKINKLKKLKIGTLYPFIYTDWQEITKINPGIEVIIIKEVSHFNTMTAIKNSVGVLLDDLKKLSYLQIIQNESMDSLKMIADMKRNILRLSPYAMKMLKDMFVRQHKYEAINLLF